MGQIKILTEQDLRQAVGLDLDALTCVENAFKTLAQGAVVMPPILRLDIAEHNGEVDVKTAYVPGLDSFALKVSPGFFDNPKIGLPSLNGLMIVFSAKTGMVEALLLDNGYLTAIRTAAAGAVAAKHLSRKNATTAAIIGAGEQGRLQLQALSLVRPISRACYWSRNIDTARLAADEMTELTGIEVTAEADAEKAIQGADIVVTCTPSTQPIIQADWLQEGQHITAMGSDAGHKNEIDPHILKKADLYVPDSLAQASSLGELHHALRAGIIDQNTLFHELGAIISGTVAGRTADDAITIADLTGTGVQDTAIATLARSRAVDAGAGFNINT